MYIRYHSDSWMSPYNNHICETWIKILISTPSIQRFKKKRHSPSNCDLCSIIQVPRPQWGWTMLYGILIGYLTLSKFVAVNFIPVSTMQCLTITVNLITAPILFRIVGSEKPTIMTLINILLCTVGVIFMVQPPGLFLSLSAVNQGDNIFGSVCLPICLFVRQFVRAIRANGNYLWV